jgi:hypothetical protein
MRRWQLPRQAPATAQASSCRSECRPVLPTGIGQFELLA